jgi:glycosyltransferase involved in cell wall biosynthesis
MKYSIILPVRNGGEYVKELINSLLAQTLKDFNVIVLDNCSTDGTVQWLESLNDKRIVIHASASSLTIEGNWARVKDVPKNEFMTMIGHDDILFPGYLEAMDGLITKHPQATLYQTHYRYIDKDGAFIRNCLPMDEIQQAHEFLACQMCRTIDSTGTGYIMRSADYDRLGGIPVDYPNLILADYALWISLMLEGYKATTSKECFGYRVHDSVSRITNGMLYQQAFGKYVQFIKLQMANNESIREATHRYGKELLMYYCESLTHRLLKTPLADRSLKVADYIRLCESYAEDLIPGQSFKPMEKFRIRIASQLDQSAIGRNLFNVVRKIIG